MMGVSAGDIRGAATGPHPVARAKGPHALTNGTPVSGHLTGGDMTSSSGPHDAQAPGRLDDVVARFIAGTAADGAWRNLQMTPTGQAHPTNRKRAVRPGFRHFATPASRGGAPVP
jgi:hypothetical protein